MYSSSFAPSASQEPPAVHAGARWRVRLLGGLQARRGDVVLTTFGSRGVAALLARLAMYPQRSHSREELIELLWPGVAVDVGRNRLRQALFTLRRLLEPPSAIPAPVIVADRLALRVVAGALACDVLDFERALREGRPAQAAGLYRGELLPGFYDDWICDERLRLAALFERADAAASAAPLDAAPHAAAASMADGAVEGRVEGEVEGAIQGEAPARAVDAFRAALPVYLTRFFGRDAEGARLRAEVLAHRLVTLLGPGGGGKTRLAVELATSLLPGGEAGSLPMAGDVRPQHAGSEPAAPSTGVRFDLVAFVPLADCATRAQMLDALLGGLRLRPRHGADPLDALVAALAGRRVLLVLDNFEQLGGQAEDVVARLVGALPGLHLLVTSRRVLGLDGEREFAVQPLGLPREGLALAEAAINPAVGLFVDRARAARADFHLGPTNLAPVLELVHLLEGLPLAIELAAARVRSLAPAAMAGLLRGARAGAEGEGIALLQRAGRRGDGRHASMLRVVEWSWRLLEPAQARLLAALTVFHGGFDAAAAEAVCGALARHAGVRLDELVAQSLLRTGEGPDGTTRYALFEPVREYAMRQLAAGDAAALRARHRAWLEAWAAALPATPDLAGVRAEMPNLLAALASALADGAPEAAVRLLLPLRRVLEDVELPAEGLAAMQRAVESCADSALRSQGQVQLAALLHLAGQADAALRHAELGLAGAEPGAPWHARALYAQARLRWRVGRRADEVLPLLDAAGALARGGDDLDLQASLLAQRAAVLDALQRAAEAEALNLESLALWMRSGNRHAINAGRYNLAVRAQNANRHASALEQLDEVERSARELHDWRRLGQALNVRGNALCGLRRWPEAVAAFREAARLAWQQLAQYDLAYVLWNLPRALAHVRDPERALLLGAFAEAFWQSRFGHLGERDRADLRRLRRLALRQIDAARVDALWRRGASLALADAAVLALG